MAESIVVHFSSASWKDLDLALFEIAKPGEGRQGKSWLYPPGPDNDVVVYEYDDILNEYESVHLGRLVERLGGQPSASLCIELRRSKGQAAVDSAADLAALLLRKFPGVVDDLDAIPELWTLTEIDQHVQKEGKGFLNCYRKEKAGGSF
jgi:hypothetical protein